MDLTSSEPKPLRMATPYFRSATALDPARISISPEYHFIRNLYGRLVDYTVDGELVSDVADAFEWQDENLVFFISNKVRTVDGSYVTAHDAARSLKRSIMMKETGHGDIRNLLCPDEDLKSIDHACRGIQVDGNKLILTPVQRSYGPHLLAMLASADFSIIPASALEGDGKNSTIISFRNTSGPYYLSKDSDDGGWLLEANPNHYGYSSDMPQKIQLVPMDFGSGAEALVNGEVDLVPTMYHYSGPAAEKVLNNRSQFTVHESVPIRISLICFTPRAIARLSVEQRLYVASIIERYMLQKAPPVGGKRTVEFFQSLSEGALAPQQIEEIQRLRSNPQRVSFESPVQFAVTQSVFDRIKRDFADFPEIEPIEMPVLAPLLPVDERLDVYVISNDSAWTESLTLLSYNFLAGIFHVPGVNGQQWIKDYLTLDLKEDRIERVTKLHHDLLRSLAIYPVSVSPYYAVAGPSWDLGFSALSAGTELWRIRRKR